MIMLGDKVKDSITGFSGIAVSEIIHINGCVRYEVKSDKLQDGKMIDSEWIDEGQLSVVKKAEKPVKKRDIGGPSSRPPSMDPRI